MTGSPGNRQDNRQRGNAAQLLEKYKTLARDAQLAGDRVQTEYYLQYADHYFRVLEESRSRFEEQQAQRRPRRDEDEFESESEGEEELNSEAESGEEEIEVEARQRQGQGRERGRERGRDRFERRERRDFAGNGAPREDRIDETEAEDEERIPLAVLPPAIGAGEAEEQQEAAKPRRRARKPRAEDGEEEIAPAA